MEGYNNIEIPEEKTWRFQKCSISWLGNKILSSAAFWKIKMVM